MTKIEALKLKGLAMAAMDEKHGITGTWASDTVTLTITAKDTPENRRKISAIVRGNYAANRGTLFVSGKRALEAFI